MSGQKKKSNRLTPRQVVVRETMLMRLTEKEAMEYLKDNEFEISSATWRREKAKIRDMTIQRIFHIAKIGFEQQHMEQIDKLETIERKMWDEYRKEENHYRRAMILKEIHKLQPLRSQYYDATKEVMRHSTNSDLSSIESEDDHASESATGSGSQTDNSDI